MRFQVKTILAVVAVLSLGVSGCAVKKSAKSYSTPQETFETWRQAAAGLDLETLLKSYASSARPSVEEELEKLSEEALASMKIETRNTDFKVERVVFEGETAYLRVRRNLGKVSEIEILTMVKESGQWLLLP